MMEIKRWQLLGKHGQPEEIETWLVHCSTKEDVESLLSLFGRAFTNSAFAKRYLPDNEKRKLFVPLYFRYLYEKSYSDGRAELYIIKARHTNAKCELEKVIGGWIYSYQTENRPADPAIMLQIYRHGAETMLRRDEWLEQNVHLPMKRAARDLRMCACLGAYQAVDESYQRFKLNSYYMMKTRQMFMTEGKRKLQEQNQTNIRPFCYVILIDCLSNELRNFRALGIEHVAHLHYNFRPGLVCCEEETKPNEIDVSCHYILCHKDMIPLLRKYFPLEKSNL